MVAHLDVEDGVVNLSDFRGTLVDRPADAESAPTVAAAAPTWAGELPDNGFRANLRAEIEPRGMATATIEGNHLPLGELFAPFLPVPTPLSGNLSIRTEVGVDLKSLRDPRAYRLVRELRVDGGSPTRGASSTGWRAGSRSATAARRSTSCRRSWRAGRSPSAAA